MDDLFGQVLALFFAAGLAGTVIGCWQCASGHNYRVAAEHEATTVGRIVELTSGRSRAYHYEFSVNGVKMDDYSKVCRTPLTPGACNNHGPVLVYYSYQPYPNSRLEDFAAASTQAYRVGKPALAIGLPLFVLSFAAAAVLVRRGKSKDDSDPEDEKGRSKSGDQPDVIHIAPGE